MKWGAKAGRHTAGDRQTLAAVPRRKGCAVGLLLLVLLIVAVMAVGPVAATPPTPTPDATAIIPTPYPLPSVLVPWAYFPLVARDGKLQ